MALTTSATYATTLLKEVGDGPQTIKTFFAKASTTYTRGDFVTVDTAGRVTVNGTDDADVDGVVASTVDNSSGANDDLTVPVIVRGNVECDFLLSATGGDFDDAIAIGTACSVAGDSGTTAAEGQALVAASATNQKFTSLSVQALPSSGNILRRGLAFFQGNGKWA